MKRTKAVGMRAKYRTPTWFKEKLRRRIKRIKGLFK